MEAQRSAAELAQLEALFEEHKRGELQTVQAEAATKIAAAEEKVRQAEAWSSHFGTMGVFISRLLPVIRHLIGIPAGIVRQLNAALHAN